MSIPRLAPAVLALILALTACGNGDDSADPDVLREGRSIYGDACSACHGNRGAGGVGPSLESVTETWPECETQVEWITLGSEGWQSAHGDTYGAADKPVAGGMPAQADRLTDAEIRLVAAFERVEYAGQEREAALADCGID